MEFSIINERGLQPALPGGGARTCVVPPSVGCCQPFLHSARIGGRPCMAGHVGAHHVERYYQRFVRVQIKKELAMVLRARLITITISFFLAYVIIVNNSIIYIHSYIKNYIFIHIEQKIFNNKQCYLYSIFQSIILFWRIYPRFVCCFSEL